MNKIHNLIHGLWLPLLGLCIPALLSSCVNEEHADERGLSVSLSWQDPADEGTEVEDVKLWIYAADGSLVATDHQGSAQEAARKHFLLPAGEYRILSTTNLLPPFTLGAASRAADAPDEQKISLLDTKEVRQNAFFGITDVTILDADSYTIVKNPVKGVLAEVSILIEGMPAGAQLAGKIRDAALWIWPMQKDADGEYGKASDETEEVEFSKFELLADGQQAKPVWVMPTGALQKNSHLQLHFRLADGTEMVSEIKAPVMKAGGKYLIQLRYEEIKSYMYLSSIRIDDWTEGWVYNGEILEPEE